MKTSLCFIGPYYDSMKERPVCRDILAVLRTGKPANWASLAHEKDWARAMDGASAWRRFRDVTLPMISPALFFVVIINTIAGLQTFDQVYTAFFNASTPYGTDASLMYAIYIFQQAFNFFKFGYASALAWVLFLIIAIITAVQIVVSRRFVYYEGQARR